MALSGLTIGKAAAQAGLSRKAVLVYEAHGLLPAAPRTAAGYRLYTRDDITMLVFIRRARALGLGLEEIAEVLAARSDGARPCHAVRDLLDKRIAEIDIAVADLLALRAALAHARSTDDVAHQSAAVCPIIENGA